MNYFGGRLSPAEGGNIQNNLLNLRIKLLNAAHETARPKAPFKSSGDTLFGFEDFRFGIGLAGALAGLGHGVVELGLGAEAQQDRAARLQRGAGLVGAV